MTKTPKKQARTPDAILSKDQGKKLDHEAPSKIDFTMTLNFLPKPKQIKAKKKKLKRL